MPFCDFVIAMSFSAFCAHFAYRYVILGGFATACKACIPGFGFL